ncbi:MAG: DUF362 domain-containing protein [Elusimicrobia bacterium]|nr:DUF362 domain-containing protein [Elusimicrobiota bacterium]
MKISNFFVKNNFKEFLNKNISRKSFIKFLGAGLGYLALQTKSARYAFAKATGQTLKPRSGRKVVTNFDLAVVKGENPAVITRKAIEILGGMNRFVKSGDTVVIKPNIGWDRTPEQAGNTNPEVVGTLVKLCRDSGAKIVKVFDRSCNDSRRTYRNTGIEDAVKKAGGVIYFCDDWKFYPAQYPKGSIMADWPMFRDAVECDVFINVPIAKDHGLTGLTLSMKNLMGVCGGNRGRIHWDIDQKLVEITEFIKPDLTVIDAYRILLRNGPTGGDLGDVEMKKTVIASADPVLADAYATTLFGMKPSDIGSIPIASRRGLGSMDIAKAKIREIRV